MEERAKALGLSADRGRLSPWGSVSHSFPLHWPGDSQRARRNLGRSAPSAQPGPVPRAAGFLVHPAPVTQHPLCFFPWSRSHRGRRAGLHAERGTRPGGSGMLGSSPRARALPRRPVWHLPKVFSCCLPKSWRGRGTAGGRGQPSVSPAQGPGTALPQVSGSEGGLAGIGGGHSSLAEAGCAPGAARLQVPVFGRWGP